MYRNNGAYKALRLEPRLRRHHRVKGAPKQAALHPVGVASYEVDLLGVRGYVSVLALREGRRRGLISEGSLR